MKSIRIIFVLLCSVFLLSACSRQTIVGDGQSKTITRQLADFKKIRVDGEYRLSVDANASKSQLVIKADANTLPFIVTEVRDQTLIIRGKKTVNLSFRNPPVIAVSSKMISDIQLADAARVIVKNLHGHHFWLQVSGNTRADLTGRVDDMQINSSGAARINARKFLVKFAKVKMNGQSFAVINVNKKLDVSISGSATVTYYGIPGVVYDEVSGDAKLIRVLGNA